jgi:hypothetical protein
MTPRTDNTRTPLVSDFSRLACTSVSGLADNDRGGLADTSRARVAEL